MSATVGAVVPNRLLAAAVVFASVATLAARAPADAAFPGRNGRIVFSSDRAANRAPQLYAVPAAGGASQNLTRTPSVAHYHPTPSPDGARVAFIGLDSGAYALWTMSRDGSDRRRLASAMMSPPSWSPDGRWLVYRGTDGSVAAIGVEDRRVVTITADGELPSWSPDGRRIAFVRGESYFVVTEGVERQVGVGLRVLTEFGRWAPSWSPDGTRFVIAAGAPEPNWSPTGPSDLYVVDASTGAAARLTSTWDSEGSPRWSRDGSRIVFARRTYDPVAFELAVVAATGGEVRRLVADAYGPEWAPDGRRVAFERAGHLFVADAETGVVWAPDGRTLYFAKSAGNVRDLFTVDPGGGSVRRLTTSPSWDADPSWSPDGRRVAFVRGNPLTVLYMVGADGRNLRRLGCPPRSECRFPAWSPDGRRIAFVAFGNGRAAIIVVRADGRGGRAIADGHSPAWSPGGRRIAFADEHGNIASVRADGGGRSVVVRGDPDWFKNHEPSWSPDGRRLVFVRTRYECAGCEHRVVSHTIVVARADGTGERELGIPTASGVAWSPDGRYLVFEQDADLAVVAPDGTGYRRVTSGGPVDLYPDWQPLPRRR